MSLPGNIKISISLMIISSPPKRQVQRPESLQYGNRASFSASICAIIINNKVILINERSFSFMKRLILLMCLVLLLMGGCKNMENNQDLQDADLKDLPDTIAMQDEFTREFMSSAEEEEEGYYLFESRTGGYTMLYPVNSKQSKMSYEKTEDSFEMLHFGEGKESSDVPFYVRSTYKQGKNTNDTELYLSLLSESLDYDGEYEEIELDNKFIYFARKSSKVDSNKDNVFDFFGYIKSKDSNQGVQYIYVVTCFDEEDDCDYDFDAVEDEAKKLMRSIKFTGE